MARRKITPVPDEPEELEIEGNVGEDEIDKLLAELDADESETSNATEVAIEKKYDTGQARIVIQRNDFLVPNILQMVENREILNIAPSYQRRARWNDTKRSHLIESLLMNVPIPPIFLYEHDLAKYEVMDGQQRLTTIRSFFKNEFKLRGLKQWPELNTRQFRDLPPRIQAGLERRSLAAVIILTETGSDIKHAHELRQYVFERLNTGGEQLNNQEVRNCIYAGHFNRMLIKVARSDAFTRAWNIPPKESGEPHKVSRKLERNPMYAKMADCEIVLRFFALADIEKSFKSSMKKTLDKYMESMMPASERSCDRMSQHYLQVLKLARNIFGEALFRLPIDGELIGRRSVPLADALLLALRDELDQEATLIARKSEFKAALLQLLMDDEDYEVLVGRGNTKAAVQARMKLLKRTVREVLR